MAYLPPVSRVRKELEFQALTGVDRDLFHGLILALPSEPESQMERDRGVFMGRTLYPSRLTHRRKR
jgi:hypothetical protein